MRRKTTRRIGRDASTGRFISVIEAKKRPAGAVVETHPVSRNGVRRLERIRSFRHLNEASQSRTGSKPGRGL